MPKNSKNSKNFHRNGSRDGKSRNAYKKGKVVRCASEKISDEVNDLSYYVPVNGETLISQLNNYSFNQFAGVPADMGTVDGVDVELRLGNIMQVNVNPSATFTSGTNPTADGINVEGLRTYTIASANNGKTTQYQPQDMTILLLAIGNLLAELSHAARAFGVLGIYNQRNRSYPRVIMQACGFDIDDIKTNAANYRTRYNYLISKFNQIPIPRNIKYFEKCSRMFQSIYLDEEGSPMAQSYVLRPYSHWLYNEAYDSQGAGLETVVNHNQSDYYTGLMYWDNFGTYLDMIEAQINALLGSAALNYIYSDIKRLNDKGIWDLLSLVPIPDNYSILPMHVEELSIMLNNAVVLGYPVATPESISGEAAFSAGNDVSCNVNGNCIIYRPQFKYGLDPTGFRPILNFKHDNPSIEEKMYATRFSHQCKAALNSAQTSYITSRVTLTDWYVASINMTATEKGSKATVYEINLVGTAAMANVPEYVANIMTMMSQFDWHPYLYVLDNRNSPLSLVGVLGDTQYYTNIDFDILRKLDDVCMMSLMQVR